MLTTSRQKQGAQWSAILSYYIQVSIVNFPTLNEDGQYEPSQLQLHGMYIEMVADDNIQISLALAPNQSHWSRAVSIFYETQSETCAGFGTAVNGWAA